MTTWYRAFVGVGLVFLSLTLAYVPALTLTYLLVYRVRIAGSPVGEFMNAVFVIPVSKILAALGVPDHGGIAICGGSLLLSVPFLVITIIVHGLLKRLMERNRRRS
jgi:hypothetical protein